MSNNNDGFEIESILGRGRDFGTKLTGMYARKYSSGQQIIMIGGDVAEKLKVKEGSRLALAQLANGMHAIVQSPCGWKVQSCTGGGGDSSAFHFFVRRGVKFLKDAEAHFERGMYVFPAGTFSESRNADRMFK